MPAFLNSQESLGEYLREHVKPYDPAMDDYDRPPFSADVVSSGRSRFYNFHYYLTKVPPESIVGLIHHYTNPGDIILDPFSGSGMTGVAVQMVNQGAKEEQRYCILNDLSPAACHIARNYTAPASFELVRKAYSNMLEFLAERESALYSINHFEPAEGLYDPKSEIISQLLGRSIGMLLPQLEFRPGVDPWHLATSEEVEMILGYPISSLNQSENFSTWLKIPARLSYVVWSDVYKCEGFKSIERPTGRVNPRTGRSISKKVRVLRGCGREIVARGTDDKQADDGNNAFLLCPHCKERWMKGRIVRVRVDPIEECYEYLGVALGKAGPHLKVFRAKRPISKQQLDLIRLAENESSNTFYPDFALNKANPRYRRDSLAGKNVHTYHDFFTRRNFIGLAILWEAISKTDQNVQSALRFCFTSQLMRCSRLRRMKGDKPGEQLSGTLHIASETAETNVFRVFAKAVEDYCQNVASASCSDRVKPFVRLGSATDLHEIPDSSVDYIFTDPPFGSNIYYSGVSLVWEAWLGVFTDEPLEAVMHREVDGGYKRINDYARLMNMAFCEMYRVLKPGRHATIEFNNSDGAVFQVIKDGLLEAGFEIINMLLFDKVARTFAQIRSNSGVSEVVDKDVLFNVRKPVSKAITKDVTLHDLEQQIAEAVQEHLLRLPERMKSEPAKYSDDHRTTATINSMLMNRLIPKGVNVERLNLSYIERVCLRYFRKLGQRWYLRGEAIGNGINGVMFEKEVQIKDEESAIAWLRQKLEYAHKTIGELKPLWMRATGLLPSEISQQLDLDTLLRDNFWKGAETNRWREPTLEEREKMNDNLTLRVLHDTERYLAGTLKRQTGDIDRCDWIDVLFKACRAIEEQETEELPALRDFDSTAGYQMIAQLFHGVLKDHVPVDIFGRAEKQARVASSRLKGAAEDGKQENQESKDKNQLEFDL